MIILVGLPRFPYPTLKGDKLRAYYQLRGLAAAHQIHLVCLADSPISEEDYAVIDEMVDSLQVIRLSPWRRVWNLARGLMSARPLQVAYFSHPAMARALREAYNTYSPDVAYLQLVRMGDNWPPGLPVPVVMDVMDAMSAAIAKRASATPWWQRWLWQMEARRLREYEARLPRRFDLFTIISDADKRCFPASVRQRMTVIPNGLPPPLLQYTRSEHPSLDLIFTGNMSYFPNVEAAEILVHQVMPILWRDHHRLKLHLVGINPSPAVRALASERVIVTGFVEDIAEYLAEAKLFVAPLFSGAGLQNKLLEAMAVGVPVVTTPHANRSLEAPVPAAIRLGHDAAGIARQTAELLASPQEAEELVNHAYEHVKTHFDWKAFNETLEHVLHQARASLRETTPREPSA